MSAVSRFWRWSSQSRDARALGGAGSRRRVRCDSHDLRGCCSGGRWRRRIALVRLREATRDEQTRGSLLLGTPGRGPVLCCRRVIGDISPLGPRVPAEGCAAG
eukprot:365291-Chlamydomonas_euryale.AAC.5